MVPRSITWLQRISVPLALKYLWFLDVRVVISVEARHSLPRDVSGVGLRPFDVLYIVCSSSCYFNNFFYFWACAINILNIHCISYELWRCIRPVFYFREVVLWIKWVVASPRWSKFDAIGRSSFYVFGHQVKLGLVESDVQARWVGPLDVPVLVAIGRGVVLLGAMQFRPWTYQNN